MANSNSKYVDAAVEQMIVLAEVSEQSARDTDDWDLKNHHYQYANGLRKAVAMLELSKRIFGDE